MKELGLGIVEAALFLLFFEFPQELLGLFVLRRDQVANAQVGQHHRADIQNLHSPESFQSFTLHNIRSQEEEQQQLNKYIFVVLLDERLVEAGGLAELVLLHEQRVGHVETPHIRISAQLRRLPEELLHLDVVLSVPVDFRLVHQHW